MHSFWYLCYPVFSGIHFNFALKFFHLEFSMILFGLKLHFLFPFTLCISFPISIFSLNFNSISIYLFIFLITNSVLVCSRCASVRNRMHFLKTRVFCSNQFEEKKKPEFNTRRRRRKMLCSTLELNATNTMHRIYFKMFALFFRILLFRFFSIFHLWKNSISCTRKKC